MAPPVTSQALTAMGFRITPSITTTSGSVAGVTLYVLPNGVRLSCGAKLEESRTEFYCPVTGGDNPTLEDGRRQLQALVRLRTDNRRLGASLHRRPRGTRHDFLCTAAGTPAGPPLGSYQATAPHAPRDLPFL